MKTISKIAAIALVAAFVVVGASSAKAATVAELQAMIAQLTAQIAALSGTTAPAASVTLTTDLTVGSTGAEVTALQNFLAAKGFLTASARGYFGALTKKAVAAYQTSKGIAAVGKVGPATRAAINADAAVVTTGTTTTTTTTVAAGSVVNDGTDGSLTASQSSYVSSGIQLKKGDTKDILAIRLKATSGAVTVSRTDVHFNVRPWLIFSKLTLKDSTGKVIATKDLSSASDATEITVGSDYLVRFDNTNYTVTPGTDTDLVVGATVLSATDKITNGQVVDVAFGTGGIRTINGKGWTDSVGSDNNLNGVVGNGQNTFTLSNTGSVADIYGRISPNSPATRQVATSLTQQTTDVVLGTFSLKSANNSSTLNTLTVNISGIANPLNVYSNVRLYDGSTSYGGVIDTNGKVVFSNLNLALAQDAWKDLSINADIASGVTGTAVVALTSNTTNVVVTDSNYNTATVEVSTATSNATTFTTNAITVSNVSSTLGSSIVQSNSTVGYNVNYQFTLTNTSNNDLFVSATSSVLATVSAGNASSTLSQIQTVSPSSYAGDVSGVAYDIPAGVSRTFTLIGAIRGTTGQTVNLKVTSINYGTSSAANATAGINFGLENLSQTANF